MRTWVNGELLTDPDAPVRRRARPRADRRATASSRCVKVVDGRPFALDLAPRAAGALGARARPAGRRRRRRTPRGRGRAGRRAADARPGPHHVDRRAGARSAPTAATARRRWSSCARRWTRGPTTTRGRDRAVAAQRARARSPASRPRRTARTCAPSPTPASAGASEAVFANLQGHLCEGTGTNVFYVVDGELRTPTLASGCLAGITRRLVLEWYGAVEVDEPIEVAGRAPSEVFLASTTRDVQAVAPLGRPRADGPRTGHHRGRARSGTSASRSCSAADPADVAGATPCARVSPHRVRYSRRSARAIGAVVARFVHTEEVTGSNPVSPTSVAALPVVARLCRLHRRGHWFEPSIAHQFERGRRPWRSVVARLCRLHRRGHWFEPSIAHPTLPPTALASW